MQLKNKSSTFYSSKLKSKQCFFGKIIKIQAMYFMHVQYHRKKYNKQVTFVRFKKIIMCEGQWHGSIVPIFINPFKNKKGQVAKLRSTKLEKLPKHL